MRITLVTEGTYPHYHGGVSVWTDQLVRQMPENLFEVIALTGNGKEEQVWRFPDNVRNRQTVALWPMAPPRPKRPPAAVLRRFESAWEAIAQACLGRRMPDAERDEAWRELCKEDLAPHAGGLIASPRAIAVTFRVVERAWNEGWMDDAIARPTLGDVLEALDHVGASFRALEANPSATDLSHAVSNGLAVLPCLVNYWRAGVPFVVSEHGVYLRERILSLGRGATSDGGRLLLQGLAREISTVAYRHAAVLAPGNVYNRRWQEHLGARPDQIETTYNGVNPDDLPVVPEPERPTLVFVGRMDPIKDVKTLIRAHALVRERVPNALLRIFGPTPRGNEAYRESCEELVASLGLQDSVAIEGRIDDVGDAYRAAQVVVLSSISEGFPYMVIEAMCSGRPVVATDVGGISEAIGDTGLTVPPRDPVRMADACSSLLLDHDERHRLGHAARERVLTNFTQDTAIRKMREVYERGSRLEEAPAEPRPAVRPSASNVVCLPSHPANLQAALR